MGVASFWFGGLLVIVHLNEARGTVIILGRLSGGSEAAKVSSRVEGNYGRSNSTQWPLAIGKRFGEEDGRPTPECVVSHALLESCRP